MPRALYVQCVLRLSVCRVLLCVSRLLCCVVAAVHVALAAGRRRIVTMIVALFNTCTLRSILGGTGVHVGHRRAAPGLLVESRLQVRAWRSTCPCTCRIDVRLRRPGRLLQTACQRPPCIGHPPLGEPHALIPSPQSKRVGCIGQAMPGASRPASPSRISLRHPHTASCIRGQRPLDWSWPLPVNRDRGIVIERSRNFDDVREPSRTFYRKSKQTSSDYCAFSEPPLSLSSL